jgi:hypothetical protein
MLYAGIFVAVVGVLAGAIGFGMLRAGRLYDEDTEYAFSQEWDDSLWKGGHLDEEGVE